MSLSNPIIITKPSNCTATISAWLSTAPQGVSCTPPCQCTNPYLQGLAAISFCEFGNNGLTEVSGPAFGQYAVEQQINFCRAQGFPVENVQIQLSTPQIAILKKLYAKDEHIRQEQTAFLVLHVVGGHIGLVLLALPPILASKIQRDWTFINFCTSWIFSSIVFCLSLYRGIKGHTFNAPFGFIDPAVLSQKCVIQASLINGAQVMTACTTMSLVIRLWLNLRAAIYGVDHGPMMSRLISASLLLTPYLLLVTFSVTSSLIADNASFMNLENNIFYCVIQSDSNLTPFLRAVYGVPVLLLFIAFVFDALVIRIMYLHWHTFRNSQMKQSVSLSSLLRVVIFSLYRLALAIVYAIAMFANQQATSAVNPETGVRQSFVELVIPVPVDILQATAPLVAFLIFGTRTETMKTFVSWRAIGKRDKKNTSPELENNGARVPRDAM